MNGRESDFRRGDQLDTQCVRRREVKLKSTLVAGGTCNVVRVQRNATDDGGDEVGDEFEVGPSPVKFAGDYDAGDPLYGLVEYWPGSRKWKFYQLDCREV